MKTVDINKKKVFYIDVDQKQCDYLQRLGMEVDARLEVINRLFTSHANDPDDSVLTSIPFQTYQKQYEEKNAEYSIAKEELSKILQPIVNEKTGYSKAAFNWAIEDFSSLKAKIEVIGDEA